MFEYYDIIFKKIISLEKVLEMWIANLHLKAK
ncbi:hypothetical protein QOZ92_000896 [Paeniclostridium ghonii]|uniref:Uncharacterized protein n=1 Tax=Paraclostridium ghonii TaxID=29358 RepID=A0ABU0MXZ2_9FIRM|nr:hypothetical protein [Paeniclostridium ghonii]